MKNIFQSYITIMSLPIDLLNSILEKIDCLRSFILRFIIEKHSLTELISEQRDKIILHRILCEYFIIP